MKLSAELSRDVFFCVLTIVIVATNSARADFKFGKPVNLGPPVNSAYDDGASVISADGLTMYFCSNRPGGYGDHDLYEAERATLNDPWGEPVNLGPAINTNRSEGFCTVSTDGLTLIFSGMPPGAAREGGYGGHDLWVAERVSMSSPWGNAANLGSTVNSGYDDMGPSLSADGLSLYFSSGRPGGSGWIDLWVTTRADLSSPWGAPSNLGPQVNSSSVDGFSTISQDGLLLFFASMRSGGMGNYDAWMAKRSSVNAPWDTPQNLGSSINTGDTDGPAFLCIPQKALFFTRDGGGMGGFDIWQAPILSVVDLNGDEIVNAADFSILAAGWRSDDPLCDIAPVAICPDGIVDIQDVATLAGHWLDDYRLKAHWKLDETEGNVARDTVGKYDAALVGGATWQTEGGVSGGAIQLDGVNDYVGIPAVLDAQGSAFSVLVWIKGGAPGQVILSQIASQYGGTTYLAIDVQEGRLMTSLMVPPIPEMQLYSDAIVTDDQWHHLGLVWDGAHRHLYVDGQQVAEDQMNLGAKSCYSVLNLGAGPGGEIGSFFAGLVDDLRVYNAALSADHIECLAR